MKYRVTIAYGWYKRGAVLEMDPSTAKIMVGRGYLEPVPEEPVIERATIEPEVDTPEKKRPVKKRPARRN